MTAYMDGHIQLVITQRGHRMNLVDDLNTRLRKVKDWITWANTMVLKYTRNAGTSKSGGAARGGAY